jgi:hypothetical protein
MKITSTHFKDIKKPLPLQQSIDDASNCVDFLNVFQNELIDANCIWFVGN